jgi:hypothetical protein
LFFDVTIVLSSLLDEDWPYNGSNGVIQGDLYPATRVQLMQSGSDQTIHVRVM